MLFKRILADGIFLVHAALFPIVLFGWLLPSMWYIYMGIMAVTLFSALTFGYCLLSKWEFDVRRHIDPTIDYDYAWTAYYVHRFTQKHLSEIFWIRASVVFLVGSLGVNIYFHYFFR
jgi:hypothetical protein